VTLDRASLLRLLREARRVALVPTILWVIYLVVAELFGAATTVRGLISPDDVSPGLLALGAVALVLRGVAFFVAPALLVYGVSARLLQPRGAQNATPPSG
jgi:hypothetical protein